MKKVLVVGGSGMLGKDVTHVFSKIKKYDVVSLSKRELDITNKNSVADAFENIEPHIVVNCAAYTDVDGCETNQEEAYSVNVIGPRLLGELCEKKHVTLVHFSTDYVFDGRKSVGYVENEEKHPINEYGRTKSLGEDALQTLASKYIIRTSWLFGKNGGNFVNTISKKSAEREIKVVNDQFGCPTFTEDLANALPELLEEYLPGSYHLTNDGVCTWFDFAEEIISLLGSSAVIVPISAAQYPRRAVRPKCSVLLNTKFKRKLPSWKDALKRYMGTET